MKADQASFAQTIDVSTLRIGETGLQVLRFGAGEMSLTGHVRTSGILRAGTGLELPKYTTTQRDAIASGQRPQGMVIFNTTTVRAEVNAGTDGTPTWQQFIPAGQVVNADVASNAAIAKSKLAALAIVDADVAGGAAIAKSKLAALNIGNSDIASNAAIAVTKFAGGSAGQFLQMSGSTVVWGAAPAGGGGPSPGGIDTTGIGDAAVDGSAATYARSDHRHRVRYMQDAGHVIIGFDSDLSGGSDGLYIMRGSSAPGNIGTVGEKARMNSAGQLSVGTFNSNHKLNVGVVYQANQADGVEVQTQGREFAMRMFVRSDASLNFRSTIEALGTRFGSATSTEVFTSYEAVTGAVYRNGVNFAGLVPAFTLDVNGQCHATSFPTSSDERFKTNIRDLVEDTGSVIDRIKKVPARLFDWNDEFMAPIIEKTKEPGRNKDGKKVMRTVTRGGGLSGQMEAEGHIGFIAQEMESEFPQVVQQYERTMPNGEVMKDARTVDYSRITAILWAAVQELTARVESLELV